MNEHDEMNKLELDEILENHNLWTFNGKGERANLTGAYLVGVDFADANLMRAYLADANLADANLAGVDLRRANLAGADLTGANLRRADLMDANLAGAKLTGAYLTGANLAGANLADADLTGVAGNMRQIKSLFLEAYPVAYTSEYLQIGCERHTIMEWWEFDDDRIEEMDGEKALIFWAKYRDFIRQAIELSPATPVKRKADK